MSCGPAYQAAKRELPETVLTALSDEGFRLFFPLSALYAALWPFLWVFAFVFDLPLANTVAPGLWHAHEMLVGAFGAALIGFLTTAAPEWTDSEAMRGRQLWVLAGLWLFGRCVGFLGWDALSLPGALADIGWMVLLLVYLLKLSVKRKTDRLIAFAAWLAALIVSVASARIGFLSDDPELASQGLYLAGLVFLGLLGLALGRITVPVTNLVLDPTEATSPFRPHPGRLNLASGLVVVAILGELAGLSSAVSGFLLIAAGAAFMDRVAEAFIGPDAIKAEIMMLAGSSFFAACGLILAGCGHLGAPWDPVTGLHLAYLGGLGLGVYAVFCIAGKLHTGQPLGQSLSVRLGAVCLCLAALLRIAPGMGFEVPGPLHGLAVFLWVTAFLCWLIDFWPALKRVG